MAGLSNFLANQEVQQTTLPSWMDTAQQNVVNQATQGVAAMPSLQNTVAGNAINTLSGGSNPFTQAQGTLNSIASGAANPWFTDSSGNMTPNTSTPMGSLFAAQNQQLQQLAPNIMDPVTAGGTASGQFGSLRTTTAADKAIADAQAKLFSDQMQAALDAQKTGVSAAGALGNVGAQGVASETALGQLQQTDPALQASTLGKIIGGVAAPQTVTASTNVSPLNQIGAIAKAAGLGTGALNSLLGSIFPKGLSGTGTGPLTLAGLIGAGGAALYNSLMKSIGGGTGGGGNGVIPTDANGNVVPGTYNLDGGGTITFNPDGSEYIKNADGTGMYYDANGQPYNGSTSDGNAPVDIGGGANPTDSSGNIDTSGAGWGTGGGTDWTNTDTGGPVDNGGTLPDNTGSTDVAAADTAPSDFTIG
jgi:hypothetical protein